MLDSIFLLTLFFSENILWRERDIKRLSRLHVPSNKIINRNSSTSRRSCHRSCQILDFLGYQSRFFCHSFYTRFLPEKNWSCLSDKIRVDRILAVEARSSSPDKILVFLLSCLILAFLEFLSDSFFLSFLSVSYFLRFLPDSGHIK